MIVSKDISRILKTENKQNLPSWISWIIYVKENLEKTKYFWAV